MENKNPRTSSYVFRSLLKASVALEGGIKRKVGNGRNISLRRDIWISHHPTIPNHNNTNNPNPLSTIADDLINERGIVGNQA